MLCAQCHTANFREDQFCRECGARLNTAPLADPLAAPADPEEDPQVERLLHEAFAQLEDGRVNEALGTAQAAQALAPESGAVHSALGSVYERQGRITEAVQQFQLALQKNPASAADRVKLQALLNSRRGSGGGGWSPQRIAIAAGIGTGVVVFAFGAVLMLNTQKAGRGAGGAASLQTSAASAVPLPAPNVSAAPARAPVQRAQPAPSHLGTLQPITPTPPSPAFNQAPAPPRRDPTFSFPVRRSNLTNQWPPPAQGTPQPAAAKNGLAPAAIGEVRPITTAARVAAPAVPNPQPAAPAPALASVPRRELPEPDAGFIKIEPIDATPAARAESSMPAPAPDPQPTIRIRVHPAAAGTGQR